MKRLEYNKVVFKESKIFYNNSLFTGEIFSVFENGQTKTEFEVLEGLINGIYNQYDIDGNLVIQRQYVKNLQHGFEVVLKSNGKKIKKSNYKNGEHVTSTHFDEVGNEIKELNWFEGIITNENLKIRKYYITNRYVFSPKLLWLNPIISSIISHFLNYLYSNCNYEISHGGGGIESIELSKNKYFQYDKLKFKNQKSKIHLENSILKFKKHFPQDYENIFHDKSIDDITELSNYKMLIYEWTFSSIIEKNISKNSLFQKKFLKISEGFKSNLKKWVVMDYSVKPIGIVFESNEKKKCLSWIENWND